MHKINGKGNLLSKAVVLKRRMLTPSTVELTFQAEESLRFKAGQWLDCFIPGIEAVGGFSITSSPRELPNLTLAIKWSKHPPAMGSHMAKVGDVWNVRVGGSFFLKKNVDSLFVGGGIGINPLYSMIKHRGLEDGDEMQVLLHSAKSLSELAYHDELVQLEQKRGGRFKYLPCVTEESLVSNINSPKKMIVEGRIDQKRLCQALKYFDSKDINSYICGPPGMTDIVSKQLLDLGLKNVFYEKWW